MKEGWERKKIKEVADVIGGSTPKTNVEEYWGGNNYWVTPAELDGSKYIEKTVRCITSNAVDKTNLTLMPSGTVLLSSRAPIGKVCITKAPMYCNQGFKNLICKELLYNEFAYYFLKHNVDYLQSLGTGATFKEISKKVVENVTIPVPPLSEQQHIVEELDLLSSIIEKKKAQLNELDNLAQSLFYEMFGDPITNDKGWEVKKIGEIAESKIGVTYKPTDVNDNGIIVLRSSNIQNSEIDLEDIVRVNCIIKDEKYVRDGDILMCTRNGSFRLVGKVALINNLPERMTYGAFMTIIRSQYNDFLFMYFQLPAFRQQLATAQTATINQITVKMLNDVKVIVPPLDLQNQFASKIEAIEHQKELIKLSIKEVETLFNSRMDYYFN